MDFSIEMPQINLFGKSSVFNENKLTTVGNVHLRLVSQSHKAFSNHSHTNTETDKTYVSNNDTFVPIDELL